MIKPRRSWAAPLLATLAATGCRFDPAGLAVAGADAVAASDSVVIDAAPVPDARMVGKLAITSPEILAIEGGCAGPVHFVTQDLEGLAYPVEVQVVVSPAAAPAPGLSFFWDATCAVPVDSIAIPAGGSSGELYARGLAPGDFTLTVSAPGFEPASQVETMRPVAERGECVLGDGKKSVTCPIEPALLDTSKAFLVFQAATSRTEPKHTMIRCQLIDTATVQCDRDASKGDASIVWQTVQLASGLRVQHLTPDCSWTTTDVAIDPVDPHETFLLFSVLRSGDTFDGDDDRTAYLASADNVEISFASGLCLLNTKTALQVVELDGAHVTRGQTGEVSALVTSIDGLDAVAPERTFLLWSSQSSAGGSQLCERRPRLALAGPTSIAVSRGAGGCADAEAIDEIAWERVELPIGAKVRTMGIALADGLDMASVALDPAVTLDRAIAFSGGQGTDGQGFGETDWADSLLIGSAVALHRLGTFALQLERASTSGAAWFAATVVEFAP